MTDKKESPDEAKKKKIANKVVTNKALYFVPDHSVSVEADTPENAVDGAKQLTNKEEDGDG